MSALALGLLAAPAYAERLLTPVEALGMSGSAPTLAGVARVRGLILGRSALADLRGRANTVVADFPLGADRTAALELVRFDPFAGTRIEIMGERGVRMLAPPDRVYFTGTVRDEPGSRAFVVAAPDGVHGFVVAGGNVYPFGPDPAGGHRSYALRDVDAGVYPAPGEFCANDLHADVVNTPAALDALLPPPVALRATTGLVQADVAIDTDYEFWSKFGADQPALDYLASLAAAASAICQRDLGVRLRFTYVRLWATSADPWAATQATDQLREVQTFWSNPANNMDALAGTRDTVHFLSGKTVRGGVSYLNALCDSRIAFGISQVYGSFDLSLPTQIWDVLVVAHELGHTFGSPHTHCYGPPIDRCYNAEGGACYAGPVVPSRGTIMSYCHLLNGGLANMDLVFGDVVTSRIRGFLSNTSCLEPVPPCGDGVLEPGEDCDDGNIASGDGCSSACRLESCGDRHLDNGEECDDGNALAGDGCSITCRIEPGCGNGRLEPGEECDDGNHTPADGCSMSCRHENVCGDATLQPGEECDDGNLVSGDGCSTACRREMCAVLRAGQRLWPYARMTIRRSTPGADRLSLHGNFQLPMPFASLAPNERGLIIRLENAAGDTRLEIPVPGGPLWSNGRGRWRFKDPNGSTNGIRKLLLLDRTRGGLPQVELKVTGRYGTYQLSPSDLPPILTVVLGSFTDGESGACGRHTYGGASCTATRNATRLACH